MMATVAEGQRARRMIISKLVLENFKSYAGKIEIGPFHKSFTSVVGPNGSGKSNVIDAILFVFGFRASKMRQGKISELIHYSNKHPNLQNCQVQVHFVDIYDLPGDDAFEIIAGTELIVTRTATKSNKSSYFVNERSSNFTEVTDLLKARGIDLDHKRFLILQGEVESISQMKPKAPSEHEDGLLEYLEDIIGTSSLKEPIQAASKQLDDLSEQRAEKLNRVKIVEKEKDGLEGKKNEAQEYLAQENELTRQQATLYQFFTFESERNMNTAKSRVDELNAKLDVERKKKEKVTKEISRLEDDYNKCNKEYETVGNQVKKAKSEFSAFEREHIQLQENIKHLKDKEKKQKKALEKERAKEQEQNHTASNCEVDIVKIGKELDSLTKLHAHEEQELEAMRESLKDATQVFQVQIEAKQRELAPWIEKRTKVQSTIEVAQAETDLLNQRIAASDTALKNLKAQAEATKVTIEEKTAQLGELKNEMTRMKKEITKLESQLRTLSEKEPGLVSMWKESRERTEEAKTGLQASSSMSNVLKQLKQQADSGRIRGIFGRLGDLGVIDAKYDVAVTTACPALDNIVVDSTETGQKCVDYLRKNNLGRSTFIIMDKIGDARGAFDTPEGVPRLFDLVKPKDLKFRNAFYHALRDTLVATDLAQANRVAYGSTRYRVVTLDGKLIDISGTMSGGGNHVARGGMSSSFKPTDVTPEEVQKLEAKRDECAEALRQCQEQQKEITARLATLTAELAASEVSASKASMDIQAGNAQLESITQQMADVKTKLKPSEDDIRRVAELDKTVLKPQRKELDKLVPSIQAIEEAIHQLQEKVLEVGGIKLKAKKAKVDGLAESLEAGNSRLIQTQVNLKTALKTASKAAETVLSIGADLEGIDDQLKDLQKTLEEKKTAAAKVQQKYKEAEKLMEEHAEVLEETKKQFEASKDVVMKVRNVEIEILSQLDDDIKAMEDNKRKVTHWKSKFEALQLQPLPFLETEQEPIKIISEQESSTIDVDKLKATIAILEEKLRSNKPNLFVIEQYQQVEKNYLARLGELNEVTNARDKIRAEYDELRKKRLEDFMAGFTQITQKLKEMYQMITLGGNAELELVDSLDPFSEGIVFSVMPPKKSWKNIANLSGGEKTLSSLALVFALHHYKPTPLYVMDEIDAALDFRNVSIVANYIKERTRNGQFIIISLRNNMFELADRLVGIYKTDSCTKSVTINPTQISVVA